MNGALEPESWCAGCVPTKGTPRRIREAIKIIKHNTVPQDTGFNISDIWRPIPTPVQWVSYTLGRAVSS